MKVLTMKNSMIFAVFLVLALLLSSGCSQEKAPSAPISGNTPQPPSGSESASPEFGMPAYSADTVLVFTDALLESVIREIVQIPQGDVTVADAAQITELNLFKWWEYFPQTTYDDILAQNNNALPRPQELSVLEYLPNLTALNCTGIQLDQAGAETLLKLRYIDITLTYALVKNALTTDELNQFERLHLFVQYPDLQEASGIKSVLELLVIVAPDHLSESKLTLSNLSAFETLETLTFQYYGPLTDLDREVFDWSGLSELHSLKSLDMRLFGLTDLSFIKKLPNLTHLDLSGNKASDFTVLGELIGLTSLSLSGCGISDISFLSSLTQLEALNLHGNNISDITALKDLTALKTLDLYNNEVSDLTPLKDLTALESLDLGYNSIADLSSLSALVNLTDLNFDGSTVSDLSPLRNLTRLETLSFMYSQVTDVSALRNLTLLRELNLRRNFAASLDALDPLRSLTVLTADNNSISSVDGLQNMTKLRELDLTGNLITDLSPLSSLTGLQILELGFNAVEDISPLSHMTELKELSLHGNTFKDLSPIIACTQLEAFGIGGDSQIGRNGGNFDDLSPLLALKHLKTLSITSMGIGTPLGKEWEDYEQILEQMPYLLHLKLTYTPMDDFSAILNMKELETLDLTFSSTEENNLSPLMDLTKLRSLTLTMSGFLNDQNAEVIEYFRDNGVTVQD
jgi:internalin A